MDKSAGKGRSGETPYDQRIVRWGIPATKTSQTTWQGLELTELAYIGFGANLGNPVECFDRVKSDINNLTGVNVVRVSSAYRSKPIGAANPQPDYINAVIAVRTELTADDLLTTMQDIESKHGRVRPTATNSARTVDLDILLFGAETRIDAALTLPHPRIKERAFVLYPLYELDPMIEVPSQGRVVDLLENVAHQVIEKL